MPLARYFSQLLDMLLFLLLNKANQAGKYMFLVENKKKHISVLNRSVAINCFFIFVDAVDVVFVDILYQLEERFTLTHCIFNPF